LEVSLVKPGSLYALSDLLRSISDPEHPTTTLEQLAVVNPEHIKINGNHVLVEFTPTVPHCGMATLIGKLAQSLHFAN
jgi:metal-sulfur cluster biosynthetic enzyme